MYMKTSRQHNYFNVCGASFKYLAMFIACMIAFVACTNDPEAPVTGDDSEFEVVDYATQTDDAVAVTSSLQAYVSPSVSNDAFGGALRNRLTNQISSIEGDNAEFLITMVIHNSDVLNMTSDGEYIAVLATHLLFGRNIVIVEPTMDGIYTFCTTLSYLFEVVASDPEGQELLAELEREAVPGARLVFEALYEMSQDDSKIKTLFALDSDSDGVIAEAFAIRGNTFHIVERMSVENRDSEMSYDAKDENGEWVSVDDYADVVGQDPNAVIEDRISAYSYGLVADMLAVWVNNHRYYVDEYEETLERSMTDIQRAAESKLSLEDIATVQKVEYTMNAGVPYNVGGVQLPVLVRFEVCSVYMESDNCDYYCIYKDIRSYNQVLNCGPDQAKKWNEDPRFLKEVLDASLEYTAWVPAKFYGPFMRDIAGKSVCYVASEDIANSSGEIIEMPMANNIESASGVSVVEYSPKNSAGSTDYSSGFSYGFDGGLCFGTDMSASLGVSFSYDKSTSRSIEDLEIVASTKSGIPTWSYIGNNLPTASFNLFTANSHTFAPSIMVDECDVDQTWIWRVPNPQGSYCLYDETSVSTCLLSYEPGFFRVEEVYSNCTTTKRVSFLMMPPPRYEQCWIRDVQPYSEAVNSLLGTLHSKYWNANEYEILLPDSSEDSDISIKQFIADFKEDLDNKKMIWYNRGMVPEGNKYTFSFYKKGTGAMVSFDFEL